MSDHKNKKITIKDVADKAEVAPSTVSRVLHNNRRISQETRKKVRAVMEELGYHPNAAARSLVQQRSRALGLILPNDRDELFMNPFFVMVMRGFSIFAQEAGYNLLYSFSKEEETELEYIKEFTKTQLIDGILLFTSRIDDKCIAYLKENGFPFVVIGRPEDASDIFWIDNDNFQAVYNATNQLINQGHTKIAFISGPFIYDYTRARLQGYSQATLNRGLEQKSVLIKEGKDVTEDTGEQCMEEILEHDIPDAVIATDDFLAIGALTVLNRRNISCAMIGFNNTLKGQYQSPALSSIDVNAEQIGHHAARLLIEVVENREPKVNHVIVPAELIERDSTLKRIV